MHRGEWLKNRIDALGYNVDSVADELQVVRTTVWRWLQKEEMPFTKMKMVADVLNIDLREDFPETSFLYKKTKQDYELLYLKEVKKNQELQEQLSDYKRSGSTGTESGQ